MKKETTVQPSSASPAIAKQVLPAVSRTYRPTADQWDKVVNLTEFIANESFRYSAIELINFKTSKVHLKGGKRVGFDCLSEDAYVYVCNGGYYEDAPEINDADRI